MGRGRNRHRHDDFDYYYESASNSTYVRDPDIEKLRHGAQRGASKVAKPTIIQEPSRYEDEQAEWAKEAEMKSLVSSLERLGLKLTTLPPSGHAPTTHRILATRHGPPMVPHLDPANEPGRQELRRTEEGYVKYFAMKGIELIIKPIPDKAPDHTRTTPQTTHQQDPPEEVLARHIQQQAPSASTPDTEPRAPGETTPRTASTASADSPKATTVPQAALPLPSGKPVARPGPLDITTPRTDSTARADSPEATTTPRAASPLPFVTRTIEPSPLDDQHTETPTGPESVPEPPTTPLENPQEPPSDDAASPTLETSRPMGAEPTTKDPVHPHTHPAPSASPETTPPLPSATPTIEPSPLNEAINTRQRPNQTTQPRMDIESPETAVPKPLNQVDKSGRTTTREPRPTTKRAPATEPRPIPHQPSNGSRPPDAPAAVESGPFASPIKHNPPDEPAIQPGPIAAYPQPAPPAIERSPLDSAKQPAPAVERDDCRTGPARLN